jgi:hypothetical protein
VTVDGLLAPGTVAADEAAVVGDAAASGPVLCDAVGVAEKSEGLP